jgi:hypothetical protein
MIYNFEYVCVLKGLRWRVVCTGLLPILAGMIPETDLYIRQQLALCFKYFSGNLVLHLICVGPFTTSHRHCLPFYHNSILK